MYRIKFSEGAEGDLRKIRTSTLRIVMGAIEDKLKNQPTVPTRHRKELEGLNIPEEWETEPPIWQLRIGDYRIFYDVDAEKKHVTVRAVRKKPPHKTTEEIL